MTNEELKAKLTALHPSVTFDEGTDWVAANIEPKDWLPLAKELHDNPELSFDFMTFLTCVDWKTHLTMVYHMTSLMHRHTLVVKAKLDRTNPVIESSWQIWSTADFHELEVYDLFGVTFTNHPGLRRLFLTDDWVGWPLRKDYEDPVNIVKL
ncbi:MAG: NADH-quinone oxidoreductase subunit C [Bacteroidia bacterium]|nr:NADH-quinone oxidoreductase subunit C [Bacteroidia bacterium]